MVKLKIDSGPKIPEIILNMSWVDSPAVGGRMYAFTNHGRVLENKGGEWVVSYYNSPLPKTKDPLEDVTPGMVKQVLEAALKNKLLDKSPFNFRTVALRYKGTDFSVKWVYRMMASLNGEEVSVSDFNTYKAKRAMEKLGFDVRHLDWL